MKERINLLGQNAREEMIRDGQNALKEELAHDASYSTTMYFCRYEGDKCIDDRFANIRVYKRQYSSLNGNYQKFLTTYDNPVKIGDYFHDTKDDTYWIVSESFNDDDINYRGKMIQCNYLLRWQLKNGDIVARYANIVSASKYDVGEVGNYYITRTSNNYTIIIGYCKEGLDLEQQRVFIDMREDKPRKVFKITRSDDVLYNSFNTGGMLSFIADKTEFNPDTDRQDLRICDYKSSSSIIPDTTNKISIIGSDVIRLRKSKIWTIDYIEDNDYRWNVVSDYKIDTSINNKEIKLQINDEDSVGSSILLQIILNDSVIAEKEITVISYF